MHVEFSGTQWHRLLTSMKEQLVRRRSGGGGLWEG